MGSTSNLLLSFPLCFSCATNLSVNHLDFLRNVTKLEASILFILRQRLVLLFSSVLIMFVYSEKLSNDSPTFWISRNLKILLHKKCTRTSTFPKVYSSTIIFVPSMKDKSFFLCFEMFRNISEILKLALFITISKLVYIYLCLCLDPSLK